jgi:WD40 repeat protein
MNSLAGLFLLLATYLPPAPEASVTLKAREPLKGHSAGAAVVFSPDGKTLVSCSAEVDSKTGRRWSNFRVWDVERGKELASFDGPQDVVRGAAFTPDGKTLATANGDNTVTLWDMTTHAARTTLKGPPESYGPAVAVSRDGKKVGVAWQKVAKIWDLESGKEISTFTRAVSHHAPVFSPDLAILASGHFQDVDLWDTAKGKESKVLSDHRGTVGRMAFTPDGKTLAVGVWRQEDEKYAHEICLWDMEKGERRKTLSGHASMMQGFALSGDAKWVALVTWQPVGFPAYELRLLDVAADRVVATVPQTERKEIAVSLVFSPDNKTLAAGYADGTVRLWDLVPPPAHGR